MEAPIARRSGRVRVLPTLFSPTFPDRYGQGCSLNQHAGLQPAAGHHNPAQTWHLGERWSFCCVIHGLAAIACTITSCCTPSSHRITAACTGMGMVGSALRWRQSIQPQGDKRALLPQGTVGPTGAVQRARGHAPIWAAQDSTHPPHAFHAACNVSPQVHIRPSTEAAHAGVGAAAPSQTSPSCCWRAPRIRPPASRGAAAAPGSHCPGSFPGGAAGSPPRGLLPSQCARPAALHAHQRRCPQVLSLICVLVRSV